MSCDMNTPYADAEGMLPQMKETMDLLMIFQCVIMTSCAFGNVSKLDRRIFYSRIEEIFKPSFINSYDAIRQ